MLVSDGGSVFARCVDMRLGSERLGALVPAGPAMPKNWLLLRPCSIRQHSQNKSLPPRWAMPQISRIFRKYRRTHAQD